MFRRKPGSQFHASQGAMKPAPKKPTSSPKGKKQVVMRKGYFNLLFRLQLENKGIFVSYLFYSEMARLARVSRGCRDLIFVCDDLRAKKLFFAPKRINRSYENVYEEFFRDYLDAKQLIEPLSKIKEYNNSQPEWKVDYAEGSVDSNLAGIFHSIQLSNAEFISRVTVFLTAILQLDQNYDDFSKKGLEDYLKQQLKILSFSNEVLLHAVVNMARYLSKNAAWCERFTLAEFIGVSLRFAEAACYDEPILFSDYVGAFQVENKKHFSALSKHFVETIDYDISTGTLSSCRVYNAILGLLSTEKFCERGFYYLQTMIESKEKKLQPQMHELRKLNAMRMYPNRRLLDFRPKVREEVPFPRRVLS